VELTFLSFFSLFIKGKKEKNKTSLTIITALFSLLRPLLAVAVAAQHLTVLNDRTTTLTPRLDVYTKDTI
jgi:hypothetical protein